VKNFIFLVVTFFSLNVGAAYRVTTTWNYSAVVNDLSCTSVYPAIDTSFHLAQPSATDKLVGCNNSSVVVGTLLTFASGGSWTVLSIANNVCFSGQHWDTSTNSCVDDVSIAVASCMPSIRTIAPCPSGFAPTNAIPTGSGGPAPFTSDMDGMPLQDMLYAIGVAICGLMGVAVGLRLV